jgi:hypothetical protein
MLSGAPVIAQNVIYVRPDEMSLAQEYDHLRQDQQNLSFDLRTNASPEQIAMDRKLIRVDEENIRVIVIASGGSVPDQLDETGDPTATSSRFAEFE